MRKKEDRWIRIVRLELVLDDEGVEDGSRLLGRCQAENQPERTGRGESGFENFRGKTKDEVSASRIGW
jgi:hypothetical protein